jgi:hypothetical protein
MNSPHTLTERCEATWNACYPDRRPWHQIGQEAQEEWHRVFQHFESLTAPPPLNGIPLDFLGHVVKITIQNDRANRITNAFAHVHLYNVHGGQTTVEIPVTEIVQHLQVGEKYQIQVQVKRLGGIETLTPTYPYPPTSNKQLSNQ